MDPSSSMGELMDNYRYWQQWAKTLNLCIQMFPLVLIITVCAYQAFKVFSAKTDMPVIERLKLLCCPSVPLPSVSSRQSLNSTSSLSQGSTNSGFLDDPPPKYTPPPSYSTATSRMLAKQLDSQGQNLNNSCSVDFGSTDRDINILEIGMAGCQLPNSRESVLHQFENDMQRVEPRPLPKPKDRIVHEFENIQSMAASPSPNPSESILHEFESGHGVTDSPLPNPRENILKEYDISQSVTASLHLDTRESILHKFENVQNLAASPPPNSSERILDQFKNDA